MATIKNPWLMALGPPAGYTSEQIRRDLDAADIPRSVACTTEEQAEATAREFLRGLSKVTEGPWWAGYGRPEWIRQSKDFPVVRIIRMEDVC